MAFNENDFELIFNIYIDNQIKFFLRILSIRTNESFLRLSRIFKDNLERDFNVVIDENFEEISDLLNLILNDTKSLFNTFANTIINNIFNFSREEISRIFHELNMIKTNTIDTKAVEILIQDTLNIYERRLNNSINEYISFFRRTRSGIDEDLINNAIAKGLISSRSLADVKKNLNQVFADTLNNSDIILINGRNYNLKKYSELVARTRTREAQTLGIIKESESYDIYLFRCSKHPRACQICLPYEGKYFYSHRRERREGFYDLNKIKPPFHPN